MLDRHGVLRGCVAEPEAAAEPEDDRSDKPDVGIAMRLNLGLVREWTEAGHSWEEIEPKVIRMIHGERP